MVTYLRTLKLRNKIVLLEGQSIGAIAAQPLDYTRISDYTMLSSTYVNQPEIHH